jgi:hypothetical protein
MTMNPLMAFLSKTRDDLMTVRSLLNLCISWSSTVLNDDINPDLSALKVSFFAFAFSNRAGNPFFNSFALSSTISSGVFPPALPPILGYMLRMVVTIFSDS